MAGAARGVLTSRGPGSAAQHFLGSSPRTLRCAQDDREWFTHTSSFPRRAGRVDPLPQSVGYGAARLTHPTVASFAKREGDGGRSANAFRSLVTAPVRAPAAASFRPRVPRVRYGERSRTTGHFRPAPGPRQPPGLRPSARRPALEPSIVATARSGGGRISQGSPGRSDRRPLRGMRPRPATHIPGATYVAAAGAAPRPINWPSPVDAPSRAGMTGIYSYGGVESRGRGGMATRIPPCDVRAG
jgi:hypothetical protein